MSATTVTSASEIQSDYMTLLVTQLQNQNPLEPMDNQDMAAQLAQFSQLQQLENVNSSFGNVLDLVQRSYASSLIGKEVSFETTAEDGTTQIQSGQVEGVILNGEDGIVLQVGDQNVSLADVTAIKQ